MGLQSLAFSDLFVAKNPAMSWFKATPDSLLVEPIPDDCASELIDLRRHLDIHDGNSDFRVDWTNAAGLRFRVKRIHIAESNIMFVCRRFRLLPGPLSSLGMPSVVASGLLASDLLEGLVIFMGKAGSGKTTTATSFISERLNAYGGVCWTIENPIELPLQGKHGKGWCYQTEATTDADIGPAVRDMMRATPNIIFIGELRDSNSVREAITAATSGHLVVATFHASDLLAGIARLVRLANDDTAASAIADAMRVAVHLSLKNATKTETNSSGFCIPDAKGTGTPARVLSVQPIWFAGKAADGLRSIVRDGDIHMLTSEVERQKRALMMNKPLFQDQ